MSHSATADRRHTEPWEIRADKLATWMFLASEIMFFAAFFGTYIVLRVSVPGGQFKIDQKELSVGMATLNTVLLISSSLTMALAVSGAKTGNQKKLMQNLGWTILLALGFLIVKSIEYNTKFSHGIFPEKSVFFGLYFLMTGFHALHVIIGIGCLTITLWKSRVPGYYSPKWHSSVECLGLYWHLVDLVWIFLFPTLYLM